MKTLYFVVEKELEDIDGVGTTNGLKTINIYEIIDNKPEVFLLLDSTNDVDSKDAINNYLEDNGFGDDEFELIQL